MKKRYNVHIALVTLITLFGGITMIFSGFALATTSSIKLSPLFSENTVLQYPEPLVYGQSNPNDDVDVLFQGKVYHTSADGNGDWSTRLSGVRPGGPFTLGIKNLTTMTALQIKNVYAGDVFLCAGQSNMRFPLSLTTNSASEIALANYPWMHIFTVPNVKSTVPLSPTEMPLSVEITDRQWLQANANTVYNFSAIGYWFAKYLHPYAKVPIGLIDTSINGSVIEQWLDEASITQLNLPVLGMNSIFYNGVIKPTAPFSIKGVLWYQGEGNVQRYEGYKDDLKALISSWRSTWNDPYLPFIIIQLSKIGSEYKDTLPIQDYVYLREIQAEVTSETISAALVVSADVGNGDLHPPVKRPVGQRAALAMRAISYTHGVEYSGPQYGFDEQDGNTITVYFTHASSLKFKGPKLVGFAIAGADMKFYNAEARIQDNTVVLYADQVPNPQYVRYGWTPLAIGNLYNESDLPAVPFRNYK